ncbi:unnamed protein product [Triticum turgidum subsp. durum]|uniref:Uncharacterized protein n=1 Tax=Triticum turgidum subsp. durum TaxID=4567 RepID=A0A9R0ZFK5_TRITD|nr:unnamed protein product [Triticum turgidum subsp. durum]
MAQRGVAGGEPIPLSRFGALVAQLESVVASARQKPPDALLCFDLLSELSSALDEAPKVAPQPSSPIALDLTFQIPAAIAMPTRDEWRIFLVPLIFNCVFDVAIQDTIQLWQRKCEDALQSLLVFGACRPVRRLASSAMGRIIQKGDAISVYSRASTLQGWLVDVKRADPMACAG